MTRAPLAILGSVGLAILPPALACKYTVREAGFVDPDGASYRLLVVHDERPSAAWLEPLRQTATAVFVEANVVCAFVRAADQAAHPELRTSPLAVTEGTPRAQLRAPDGRTLELDLPRAMNDGWPFLEGIVSSPLRDEFLARAVGTFAVPLLFEGADASHNEAAAASVTAALAGLATERARFPKPIGAQPRLRRVTPTEARAERVLCWSLGLERPPTEPTLMLLYGRGRRFGAPLSGGSITASAVAERLRYLGQDCECDLDRAWLRGPLVPLRWGRDLQRAVVQQLGFDAESPWVKNEISRILARGPSATPSRWQPGLGLDRAANPAGYAEVSFDEPAPALADVAPAHEPASPWRWTGWTVGCLACSALGTGGWLLWRARHTR